MSDRGNGKRQHSEDFAADTVDVQIEALLTTKVSEPRQPAGARLTHDLTAMSREDAASLDRIWQRLSSHDAFDEASRRADKAGQIGQEQSNVVNALPLTTYRRRYFRLGNVAAAACIILLVGSLAVVLSLAHKSATGVGIGLCTPTDKDTTAPAPVVFTEKPGQSGLYVTGGQGIYRFDVQSGQPQPLWVFKMNACVPVHPTIVPGGHMRGFVPTPSIISNAVVANDMVFFIVDEMSSNYLYVLHTQDGSLAWKANVGVSGTPFVLNGLVVIETADNAGNPVIMALDARNGSIRWSHPYSSSNTDQSIGLGAVGDGRVYVSTFNSIFALDITNGQQVWNTNIKSGQIIGGMSYFDGTLYATASSTCFNCEAMPGTSAAYAFDPATGNKQWESKKVAGYLSPPTEVQGVVYFGSIDGSIHALHASDGTQIWQSNVTGEVQAAPVVADGLVLVQEIVLTGAQLGQFDAFDTAGHLKGSFDPGDIVVSDSASSISVGQGLVYIVGNSNYLYLMRASTLQLLLQYPINDIYSGNFAQLESSLTLVP